jgi:hypothetical protein
MAMVKTIKRRQSTVFDIQNAQPISIGAFLTLTRTQNPGSLVVNLANTNTIPNKVAMMILFVGQLLFV